MKEDFEVYIEAFAKVRSGKKLDHQDFGYLKTEWVEYDERQKVAVALGAEQGHPVELRHRRPEAPVAPVTRRGDAPVDDRHRDPRAVAAAHEVGPDLELHQHHADRRGVAQEAPHEGRDIDRKGRHDEVGKYLAPTACRHCEDPVCIHSCPTGAIKRRPEGEIFIDYKTCTGVGACTLACPYGNIQMVDSLIFDQAQARKQRLHPDQVYFRPFPENIEKREVGLLQRLLGIGSAVENEPVVDSSASDGHKVPPTLPVKCDLCDGLPFMGCVHACPTGAAIRIDPRTLFEGEGVVESGSAIAKAGRGESK